MSYLVNEIFLFLHHTLLGVVKHSTAPNGVTYGQGQILISTKIDGKLFSVLNRFSLTSGAFA